MGLEQNYCQQMAPMVLLLRFDPLGTTGLRSVALFA